MDSTPSLLIEESRPASVQAVVRGSGLFFLPVSPVVEWHSYHLPLGVDGIIAEGFAQLLAQRLSGLYARVLPLGLDAFRSEAFKQSQGLVCDEPVFGMNYPHLPVRSEYHEPEDILRLVGARLTMLKGTGFRRVYIINHHGGEGQMETLERCAQAHGAQGFQVEVLHTVRFNTFFPAGDEASHMWVGGHAGLAETIQTMAFRPDLVDVSALPEGELSAASLGILHDEKTIPAKVNPRLAKLEYANAWRESVLAGLVAHVQARG